MSSDNTSENGDAGGDSGSTVDGSDSAESTETSGGGSDDVGDDTEVESSESGSGGDSLYGLEWLTNCDIPNRMPKNAQEFREVREVKMTDLKDIADPLFAKVNAYHDESQHSECVVTEDEGTCIEGEYVLDNGVKVGFSEKTVTTTNPEGTKYNDSLVSTTLIASEQTPDWQTLQAQIHKLTGEQGEGRHFSNIQWTTMWKGEFFGAEWGVSGELLIYARDTTDDGTVEEILSYNLSDVCNNIYTEFAGSTDGTGELRYELSRRRQVFSVVREAAPGSPTLAFSEDECVAEIDPNTWEDIGPCP